MKYYFMLAATAVFMTFMVAGCDDEKSSDTSADTAVEAADTSAETAPSDTADSDTGDSDTGDSDSGDTAEVEDTGSDAEVSD
mgnify:FL=1|tara:strand:+ start:465 stop:710 length:246 start_codon:yes stop_codon:yes gene_type:complete